MTGKSLAPLFTWRSALCDDAAVSPTQHHVAVTLSLYMNERGASAFPGAARLARDAKLHVSTVRRALDDLVEAGWLALVHRGGQKGERKQANQYEARVPATPLPLAQPDPSTIPPVAQADPSQKRTRRRNRVRPVAQDDPNSSCEYSIPPGGGALAPLPDADQSPSKRCAARFVAHYLDMTGERPPEHWIGMAAKHGARALADGRPFEVVDECLRVCAVEGKAPSALHHVIGDYFRVLRQAGVP